jgi:hypothetical protein
MRQLSVSDLELFRRYRTDEDFPFEAFLAQLQRREGPTLNMRAGTALHALLEQIQLGSLSSGEVERYETDEFSFSFSLDAAVPLSAVRECSGQRVFQIGDTAVELRGRCDELNGTEVVDHKVTFSPFDAIRYVDSVQWRAYLAIFGAHRFRYNVFVAKDCGVDDRGLTQIDVREYHALTLHSYPALEADVEREVGRFVEFAQAHLWREVA